MMTISEREREFHALKLALETSAISRTFRECRSSSGAVYVSHILRNAETYVRMVFDGDAIFRRWLL